MEITKIQKAIYSLLQTEPFYGHFILESKIMYDAFNVPTAAVAIVSGIPLMIFNRKFLEDKTQEQVVSILKHEILHLVFSHLITSKDEKLDAYIHNIAADCTINQYIKGLPEGCVTLSSLEKATGKTLEPFQTSDYYYKFLMDKKKELEDAGMKTLDEHGVEVPGQDCDAIAKGAIEKAVKKATKKSAGNVPDFIVSEMARYGESKINWKQLLRNFILTRVIQETKTTYKKINRRFALPVPGKKKKRSLTLGVCLDSSGSVSDDQYVSFLNEVKSISKQVSKVYLVHADCEVQAVEELTPTKKLSYTRKGNGGTAYGPAIKECVKLKCDVIIYFGDMDTSDLPINPRVPFLWVAVGEQKPPADFGKVIRI